MDGITVCVFTDTIVGYPTHLYDKDDNLSYINVKEDVLFDWFKTNILPEFRTEVDDGISDRGVMDEWLDEYTADETVNLYDYAVKHKGLVYFW